MSLAIGVLLAFTTCAARADMGRGSIRGAARAVPAPRAPDRAEPVRSEPVHAEPAHPEPARPPERAAPPPQARPDDHRDVHAPPPPPAHRDWDDNDEDRAHFGGFAHPAPVRIARGTHIHDLPHDHWDFDFNHHHYFFDDTGVFYEPGDDGQYVVIDPPVGAVVPNLPTVAVAIQFGPTVYYYVDGTFFIAQDGGYAVVAPPAGIVVPTPPSGAQTVISNGVTYYQFNGFNYTPVIQDGTTGYSVTPI